MTTDAESIERQTLGWCAGGFGGQNYTQYPTE